MTQSELRLWARVQRRASSMAPDVAAAIVRAFDAIRESLGDTELTRIIELGFIERLANVIIAQAVFDAAMQPVRNQIRFGLMKAVPYFARELPKVAGQIGISFDVLNPRVIDAIRALESKVITDLETSVRDTVRLAIENGLRDGLGPRVIARGMRPLIGLGPDQLEQVQNFRDALAGLNGRTLADYTLRDKRLDGILAKRPLTPEQIDRAAAAYMRRRIAQNAETVARTASLDAQKLAQRLSYADAIDKGVLDGDRLMHQWIGVNDDRERPEHVAMNNEVQPWDQTYSNGELIPGESTYNCRCIDRVFLARA